MGFDGGADLGADAFVGAEERHVAVGGSAGDDFEQAFVVEVAEAADDVAGEVIELIEGFAEEALPEAGGFGVLMLAHAVEVGFVFAGGGDFSLEVARELGDEDGVGELLEQDGRKIEVAVEGDAVALKTAEDAQEREVGFGGGFQEPLHAVGPGAVIDDVREVSVQGEREKARRDGLRNSRGVWLSGVQK